MKKRTSCMLLVLMLSLFVNEAQAQLGDTENLTADPSRPWRWSVSFRSTPPFRLYYTAIKFTDSNYAYLGSHSCTLNAPSYNCSYTIMFCFEKPGVYKSKLIFEGNQISNGGNGDIVGEPYTYIREYIVTVTGPETPGSCTGFGNPNTPPGGGPGDDGGDDDDDDDDDLPLDLSVGAISVIEAPKALDGSPSLQREQIYNASVAVNGSGFKKVEDRSTTLKINIGAQVFEKTVSLAALKATGTLLVPFQFSMGESDVGTTLVSASVNPVLNLTETNFLNNLSTQKVHVLCSVSEKNVVVPTYRQFSSPWGAEQYANSVYPASHPKAGKIVPMSSLGCMTTSVAMLYKSYGILKTASGVDINPGTVNAGFKASTYSPQLGPYDVTFNGYSEGNDVQRKGVETFGRDAVYKQCVSAGSDVSSCVSKAKRSISYLESVEPFTGDPARKVQMEICKGNPIILKVPSLSSPLSSAKSHFVVAKEFMVDRNGEIAYVTNDPGVDVVDKVIPGVDVLGFNLYSNKSDGAASAMSSRAILAEADEGQGMIQFQVPEGVDMVVTDPNGYRMGSDPLSRQTYSEVDGGRTVAAESIGATDDKNVSTVPETRFEIMRPVSGVYSIQLYSGSDRNVTFTNYSFDSAGGLLSSNRKVLKVKAGSPTLVSTSYSAVSSNRQYASLTVGQAVFFDNRYKDMAFVSGTIKSVDGRSLGEIERFIKVTVGKYSKLVEKKNLIKIKSKGQTSYTYLSLSGKAAIVLNINITTGIFNLFVSNIDIDNGKNEISADMSVEIDNIYAANVVSFKNIKRVK